MRQVDWLFIRYKNWIPTALFLRESVARCAAERKHSELLIPGIMSLRLCPPLQTSITHTPKYYVVSGERVALKEWKDGKEVTGMFLS